MCRETGLCGEVGKVVQGNRAVWGGRQDCAGRQAGNNHLISRAEYELLLMKVHLHIYIIPPPPASRTIIGGGVRFSYLALLATMFWYIPSSTTIPR